MNFPLLAQTLSCPFSCTWLGGARRMTSIIKFTPLSGVHSEDPLCYLLEIDEYCVLLDCGWNDSFDPALLASLAKVAPKIDCVLLSHPDLNHLGALPYAVGKLGLKAKIYATIPTSNLGQMSLYDAYLSRNTYEEFSTFTLDDVDDAFGQVILLKYSQRVTIAENGIALEITPFAAGHTLGGTIWRIKSETDEIVYAVDYNHKKERHLKATLFETLHQPTLLITDSLNAMNVQLSRKARDGLLFDSIRQTLDGGGSVLCPVDSASRVLELLLVLDQYWRTNHILYPLIFLNTMGTNTVEFARKLLEWMSDAINERFMAQRDNAFQLPHVKIFSKISQVDEIHGPKVVLCSMPSLFSGYAQELFIEWAANSRNRIIFTDRSRPNTPARRLMENPKIGVLHMERWTRVPLQGAELEEFEKRKKAQQEAQLAKKRVEEEYLRKRKAQLEMHDYEGEDTTMIERRSVYDDYGETIRPEDFLMITEDETNTNAAYGDEEAMDIDISLIPNKCIFEAIKVTVNCAIQYLDFEGRSDGRSIKKILNRVNPRKMILVHGTPEATHNLVDYMKKSPDPPKALYAPYLNETIDVTEATDLYRIHLKSNFLKSLNFVPAGGPKLDYRVAYVDGIVMIPPKEGDNPVEPFLDVRPSGHEGHPALYVGDVKLSDFRKACQDNKYTTEFPTAGVLVVNGSIALRQTETDTTPQMQLEGAISEDYFKLRDFLYKQYQIL